MSLGWRCSGDIAGEPGEILANAAVRSQQSAFRSERRSYSLSLSARPSAWCRRSPWSKYTCRPCRRGSLRDRKRSTSCLPPSVESWMCKRDAMSGVLPTRATSLSKRGWRAPELKPSPAPARPAPPLGPHPRAHPSATRAPSRSLMPSTVIGWKRAVAKSRCVGDVGLPAPDDPRTDPPAGAHVPVTGAALGIRPYDARVSPSDGRYHRVKA
jgi:hypothetical protein